MDNKHKTLVIMRVILQKYLYQSIKILIPNLKF